MDENILVKKLCYNEHLYKLYKDYQKNKKTNYMSFENFLFFGDNLCDYIKSPLEVKSFYYIYHDYQKPKDFEDFETFCETFNLFPFDENLINDDRCCENCLYNNFNDSIIGSESISCTDNNVSGLDNPCFSHLFNFEKGRALIENKRRLLLYENEGLVKKLKK